MKTRYDLPDVEFVSGDTYDITIDMYDSDNIPIDLSSAETFSLAIMDFVNRTYGSPDKTISNTDQFVVSVGDHGVKNRLTIYLYASDTKDLYGKYLYQITVGVDVLGQGCMMLYRNISASE